MTVKVQIHGPEIFTGHQKFHGGVHGFRNPASVIGRRHGFPGVEIVSQRSEFSSNTVVPSIDDYSNYFEHLVTFSYEYDFLSNKNFDIKIYVEPTYCSIRRQKPMQELELPEDNEDTRNESDITGRKKVILDSSGSLSEEISVIKAIKEKLCMNLSEAHSLVKSAPIELEQDFSTQEANDLIACLRNAGATAHIKGAGATTKAYTYKGSHIPYNFSAATNKAYLLDAYTVIFDSEFKENKIKIYQKGIINKKRLAEEMEGKKEEITKLENFLREKRGQVIADLKKFRTITLVENNELFYESSGGRSTDYDEYSICVMHYYNGDNEIISMLKELSKRKFNKDCKRNAKQSNGCYVATCVYGSYDCPEVWTLRRFRDDTLGATWYGRLFIKTYYAISPTLVKWFGKTKWFKDMWKPTLDNMVRKLQAKGVENTPYKDKIWR